MSQRATKCQCQTILACSALMLEFLTRNTRPDIAVSLDMDHLRQMMILNVKRLYLNTGDI